MLEGFKKWSEVVAAARGGEALWYHAPMDVRAVSVRVVKVTKDGRIRLDGGGCKFTADEGHLSRFKRKTVTP